MKRILILLVFVISCFFTIQAQKNAILIVEADSLFSLSEYEESSIKYLKYLAANSTINDQDIFYHIAVSLAKIGNAEKSTYWLQRYIDTGAEDKYLTETRFDINFYAIHHTSKW